MTSMSNSGDRTNGSVHSGTDGDLWKAFVETRSIEAREALFHHYMPYARAVAAQLYAQRHRDDVEFNDFRQFALIGLIESIDRYEPDQAASFETFCTLRVKGAVLDGVQKLTDGQEQISFMRRMQRERIASLKIDALHESGSDEDTFRAFAHLAAGLAIGYMLDETSMVAQPEDQPSRAPLPWQSIAWRQTRERLITAVSSLPDRHRKILHYHYFNGLPFEQIAKILNLSKARISQLHRDALAQLRQTIGSADRMYFKG